jgi:hypothetical protein
VQIPPREEFPRVIEGERRNKAEVRGTMIEGIRIKDRV